MVGPAGPTALIGATVCEPVPCLRAHSTGGPCYTPVYIALCGRQAGGLTCGRLAFEAERREQARLVATRIQPRADPATGPTSPVRRIDRERGD